MVTSTTTTINTTTTNMSAKVSPAPTVDGGSSNLNLVTSPATELLNNGQQPPEGPPSSEQVPPGSSVTAPPTPKQLPTDQEQEGLGSGKTGSLTGAGEAETPQGGDGKSEEVTEMQGTEEEKQESKDPSSTGENTAQV